MQNKPLLDGEQSYNLLMRHKKAFFKKFFWVDDVSIMYYEEKPYCVQIHVPLGWEGCNCDIVKYLKSLTKNKEADICYRIWSE